MDRDSDLRSWTEFRRQHPPSEQKFQEGYSYADYQQFLEDFGVFLHFDCSQLPRDDSYIIRQPSCSNRLSPIVSGGQFFAKNVAAVQLRVFSFLQDFHFALLKELTS